MPIFGYDKYSEVTSEHCIRGNYCDLATKIDGAVGALIEVKAVGLELKDNHVRQVIDYAANQGSEWVLLVNGVYWRVYHVVFGKPIEHELVADIDFSKLSWKSPADLEMFYLLCKEGWIKSVLGDYHTQQQALSRFSLGAILLTEPVLDVVRRELRRVSPDVRIESEQIRRALSEEVLKREVMEGDRADDARKRVARAGKKALRATTSKEGNAEHASAVDAANLAVVEPG